jgi:hypothetical protein
MFGGLASAPEFPIEMPPFSFGESWRPGRMADHDHSYKLLFSHAEMVR